MKMIFDIFDLIRKFYDESATGSSSRSCSTTTSGPGSLLLGRAKQPRQNEHSSQDVQPVLAKEALLFLLLRFAIFANRSLNFLLATLVVILDLSTT